MWQPQRWMVLFWIALLGCLLASPPATAQVVSPAGEPNDTFGSATPVDPSASWQATLFPQRDSDWYVFQVDHQGELQLQISAVAPNLDLVVRVWTANKDLLHDWISPLNQGGETLGTVDLPEPGRYLLEVRDGNDSDASEQPYTLTTLFTPTVDPNEPNPAFGLATALAFDQPMQATILPHRDADWYTFAVEQHGELQVAITDPPANLDMVFRVWNGNHELLADWQTPLNQGGETLATVDLPQPGRYYLELRDGSDSDRSVDPYTLTVRFLPSADLFEPNAGYGTAAPLKIGESLLATLLPSGDNDWFVVTVDRHGELRISVTEVPPELAVFVRVWDANGNLLQDWLRPLAPGGNTAGTLDLPQAGSYYLQVAGDTHQRSIQPYRLRVDFTAAVDALEPNSDFGHAAPIGLGRTVQANLLPAHDADWYSFDLTSPGELHVTVTDVAPNLAVFLRVWNANKDLVYDWFRPLAPGGNTDARFDLGKPGRYFLELLADGDQRSIHPYTLTLGYTLAADPHESNDTPDTAAALLLDQSVAATLLPANDVDYYTLAVPTPGDLYLLVTHVPSDLRIRFRLWESPQTLVADWVDSPTPGADSTLALSVSTPISYLIEVRASDSGARSVEPYWLLASRQPIDSASVQPPPDNSATPTTPDSVPVAPDQSKVITTSATTGKVSILTSGQIGPLGGDLFVTDRPGWDGARLEVPPGALKTLTTLHIGVTADPPTGSPFGMAPNGSYWVLTPAGLTFQQPVTLTLPVPAGSAAPQLFVGHWDGQQWLDLGGSLHNGALTAATDSFSPFGVFCGRLSDYTSIQLENGSSSPYIELRYLSGPSPDPAAPDPFLAGCPQPADIVTQWQLNSGEVARLLLAPGVYSFMVSYPQPQPGVANPLFLTVPPNSGPQEGPQTVRIADDGATSDTPALHIVFAGRTAASNLRPLIACSAEVPAGVTLASGVPAAPELPSRIVQIHGLRLEQLPPKGPGIRLLATASDPEKSQLRPYWTVTGGLSSTPIAGNPVPSGTPLDDTYQFQPTLAGTYTLFLTVYDDLGLFDECRWVIQVEPNHQPEVQVFSGRTVVEFGRLDELRSQGVGPISPATPALRPGVSIPLAIPAAAGAVWDGLTLCPTALAGPFPTLPTDLEAVVPSPAPVDALLPTVGADSTHRWAFPGRTCVWALTADADSDVLTTTWEFPGPIYGSGTFYAAVTLPAGFAAELPEGLTLGSLIRTSEQLEAYNRWVSTLYTIAGVPPAIVWEAWDDPCPPGSGEVETPCPSALSAGGVENIVAQTTDGFSQPPRTGYTPIAVLPEGMASAAGECDGVFWIASLTPNPSDPGPAQNVEVTARLSPLVEGCVLQMTIVGTDGYANQANIATNRSGEAAFFIPGGADGIVDVVTAAFCSPMGDPELLGTPAECTTPSGKAGKWVQMEVEYTF